MRADGHIVNTRPEAFKAALARHVTEHTHVNLLAAVPWMRLVVREPGDKLVTDYPGVFSLYTPARVIDMWGLCNADIALRGDVAGINPIYGKTCPACYREFDPDYFHVNVPVLRPARALASHAAVISNVFQAAAIDPHVDLKRRYATGRVRELATDRSLYFLERRRPDRPLAPRAPAPGFVVEYPFEPGGRR